MTRDQRGEDDGRANWAHKARVRRSVCMNSGPDHGGVSLAVCQLCAEEAHLWRTKAIAVMPFPGSARRAGTATGRS